MGRKIYDSKLFKEHRVEIVEEDCYHGYDYVITTCGSHPCAYVRLPENHIYNNLRREDNTLPYDEIPVECHGGLTFSCVDGLPQVGIKDGVYIGWDYAHYGDYCDFGNSLSTPFTDKIWTHEEICEEIEKVILQLKVADLEEKHLSECMMIAHYDDELRNAM